MILAPIADTGVIVVVLLLLSSSSSLGWASFETPKGHLDGLSIRPDRDDDDGFGLGLHMGNKLTMRRQHAVLARPQKRTDQTDPPIRCPLGFPGVAPLSLVSFPRDRDTLD